MSTNPQPRRLGDLTSAKRVYACCANCRRSELLNVRGLIERYGPKVPVAWFKRMLRCTRCGGRKAELHIVAKRER